MRALDEETTRQVEAEAERLGIPSGQLMALMTEALQSLRHETGKGTEAIRQFVTATMLAGIRFPANRREIAECVMVRMR